MNNLFIYFFVLFLSFGLFAEEQLTQKKYSPVMSGEEAEYVFMNAVRETKFERKEYLFNEILKYYYSLKEIPYKRICLVYNRLIWAYIEFEEYSKFENLKNEINLKLSDNKFKSILIDAEYFYSLQFKDKYKELQEKYKKLIKEEPKLLLGYGVGSIVEFYLGNYEEVLKVLDLAPNKTNPDLLLFKGYSLFRTGKYEDALTISQDYAKETSDMEPKSSFPYYLKSLCEYKLGKPEEAKKDYEEGKKLDYIDILLFSKKNDNQFKDEMEKEIVSLQQETSK
ncbi:MAG: hypothetical protein ACD_79C00246G0002 [uncultured bacterium]|nr:MAG: hypothetical protein ACD_79C00246G0002 [uncultured bacterium]